MLTPDLHIVAEGDVATGEHWILRAGGSATSFYSMLETVHPTPTETPAAWAARRLPAGQLLNTYTGRPNVACAESWPEHTPASSAYIWNSSTARPYTWIRPATTRTSA